LSPLVTSLVICLILIGASLLGALLRRWLPEHHLDANAKDVVRLGCGLIGTITGLVLGLLVNSAKTSFEVQRDEIRLMTANAISVDHLLMQYGPEAREARLALRAAIAASIDRIWNEGAASPRQQKTPFSLTTPGEAAYQAIRRLAPADDNQRALQSQAIQTVNAVLQMRLVLYEQAGSAMPVAFLVVLVFWLAILFVSFSLFSPLSPTALGALVVFALSASGAIFLILEMYQPFDGLMRIDSAPLRQALLPLT
jgi:hypothetical protein